MLARLSGEFGFLGRGRAIVGALIIAAVVVVTFTAHQHIQDSRNELISIESINKAKDSLTEAADSGNPKSLKNAIITAEKLLQGLRDARGRVHQLAGDIPDANESNDVDISPDEEPQLGTGLSVSDVSGTSSEAHKVHMEDMLQKEKDALKNSLAENDREMKSIERVEQRDETEAQQQGSLKAAATARPEQDVADDAVTPPEEAESDPDINNLEQELMRQKREYREAKQAYQRYEDSEHNKAARTAEELAVERQIRHYRQAREAIMHALPRDDSGLDKDQDDHRGGTDRGGERDSRTDRHWHSKDDSENARPASLVHDDGERDHPKHDSQIGSRQKSESIVSSIRHSLGDTVMRASDVGHSHSHAAQSVTALPGINTDSWWVQAPKLSPRQMKLQEAARKAKEAAKAPKKDCHDLYSCVGSFFVSGSKKPGDKSDVLHLDEQLHHAAKAQAPVLDKVAGDNMVSKEAVLSNPQQPLLAALQPSTSTHTLKLPGVVENRWGGTRFWDRLLGTPASQAKHALHRRHKIVLTH